MSYQTTYRRMYRRELWDQGLCIECKQENPTTMRLRCSECAAKNVRRTQAARARRMHRP